MAEAVEVGTGNDASDWKHGNNETQGTEGTNAALPDSQKPIANSQETAKVASPCVGICRRNDGGFCMSCGRSVVEIMRWDQMAEVQKKQVLEHVAQRRRRKEEAWGKAER